MADGIISHVAVAKIMTVPREDPQVYDLLITNRLDFTDEKVFRVTVTKKSRVIKNWIYKNKLDEPRSIIGIDVQWDRRDPYFAHTLQLCLGKQSLLIQLSSANGIPSVLRSFLMDRRNKFVGLGDYLNGGVVNLLSTHNLVVTNTINLAFNETIPGRSSIENIASKVLGITMSSGFAAGVGGVDFWDGMKSGWIPEIIISDWGNDFLSREQVQFSSIASAIFHLVGVELKL